MSAQPQPAAEAAVASTKERLLDAAERLFAERGFEGTSLRAVTQAAGASLSAANYHFGSKEALLHATLLRRVEPVNRERLERLDALERRHAGAAPPLEEVLEAYFGPMFASRKPDRTAQYRQVAARLYSDPADLVDAVKLQLFAEIARRFQAALQRALPERSERDVAIGFQFVVALMVHTISGQLDGSEALLGAAHDVPDDELLARTIAFAAAGLCAASPRPLHASAARGDGS